MERIVNLPLLVVILGPTGSGKTALALFLAETLDGEIVSCDSLAVYRELEIGTAKPTREERQRMPHHLIDVAAPTDQFTAGDYSRLARKAIHEIRERRRLPVVVGGTGLYLRALLEGLFAGVPRSEDLRSRLRERATRRSPEYLHRLLRRVDPAAAKTIHANDVAKMIRALEVVIRSGHPITELWREGRDPLQGFRILRLGLNPDRDALYERLNQRAGEMFAAGLIEETRALQKRYGRDVRSLRSLGYRQASAYLDGTFSLDKAILAVQQGHRNYAKRQLTWFRREPDVQWRSGFGSDPEIQKECLEVVKHEIARKDS
jgi:tRNA dimethylallyltransferase